MRIMQRLICAVILCSIVALVSYFYISTAVIPVLAHESLTAIRDYKFITPKFKPFWNSLDRRIAPSWYDKAKIGIFIHWGVYSVPSYNSEWFWSNWNISRPDAVTFMKNNYKPNFRYQDFAKDFTAEFFDPDSWSELFYKSGARYVVLTSKHHDGYTLWPSKYTFGWNAMDIGPHRDIIAELSAAVRKRNMTFGLYHSLYEWFNRLYLSDKATNFTSKEYVLKKMLPEMYELVNIYKPEIFWSDGDWEASDTYFNSTYFLAWLYNFSPVRDSVVVNDRWGRNNPCHHGDFFTCTDRYNPGELQSHKWENAMTLDKSSWGYRRVASLNDYLTIDELLTTLIQTVSCGGNLLLNVGPSKDGLIGPIFQERLLQMGSWLQTNGEAIYETTPCSNGMQNDTLNPHVWYTCSPDKQNIYLFTLIWPKNNQVTIASITNFLITNPVTKMSLLGDHQADNLKYLINSTSMEATIALPDKATVETEWVWVVRISKV